MLFVCKLKYFGYLCYVIVKQVKIKIMKLQLVIEKSLRSKQLEYLNILANSLNNSLFGLLEDIKSQNPSDYGLDFGRGGSHIWFSDVLTGDRLFMVIEREFKNSEFFGKDNSETLLNDFGLDIDNLVIVNSLDEEVKTFRPIWSYAHGELENLFGNDIVDFKLSDQGMENSSFIQTGYKIFPEGIYECKTENGDECLWFLWYVKMGDNHPEKRNGLIVRKDDEKSVKYAQKCFINRVEML